MDTPKELNDPRYIKAYSEEKLWDKVLKIAKIVGIDLVYLLLILFYVLEQPSTPNKAKGIIIAALGYFISPLDAIPDIIPGVGHVDDWVLLVAALGCIAIYVTDETKAKARERLRVWFGDYDVKDLSKVDGKIKDASAV